MITLLIVSFAIFALYIAAILYIFGVPYSISDSHYLLNRLRKNLGILFTIWCFIIAFTVIPIMFEMTDGKWFQFLGLFTGGGLGFVGAAPLFKSHEKTIHYTSAAVCAASALSWMILYGYWYLPAIAIVALIYPAYRDKKWTFWGELVLFASMYTTLLLILL